MPRILSALTLCFALTLVSGSAARAADDFVGPPDLPVLGADQVSRGLLVEDHAEILMRWAFKGFRKMTVVHVDALDGLHPFGPGGKAAFDEARAADPHSAGGQALLRDRSGFFGEADILRVARESGMVGRIVWITPMPVHLLGGDVDRLRPLLESAGFSPEDSASVAYANGCYAGTRGGIPLEICSQETLPPIAEPILLSMDLNYFGYAAQTRKASQLDVAFDFFRLAEAREYRLADVVFSYSIATGENSAFSRWIGDVAVDLLRNPAIRRDKRRPPEYTILQKAEQVAAEEDYEAMYDGLSGYLRHYPGKAPALLLANALAAVMTGRTGEALSLAEQSCRGDEGYCSGLMELGLRLLEAGDVEGAGRFFDSATRLRPGIVYDDMGIGAAWLKAGEYDKALASFSRLARRFPDYPYGLLIGQVYLAKGEPEKALPILEEVVSQVESGYRPLLANPYVAAAAREAVDFLKARGMAEEAGKLESRKWLFLE